MSADVVIEIARQVVALSAKAELLQLALKRPDFLVELLHVDVDVRPTSGAAKATLRAKPTDLALELLAAVRAGNRNLLIIEKALGHLTFSSGGCGDPGEPRPAESRKRGAGGADGADR